MGCVWDTGRRVAIDAHCVFLRVFFSRHICLFGQKVIVTVSEEVHTRLHEILFLKRLGALSGINRCSLYVR